MGDRGPPTWAVYESYNSVGHQGMKRQEIIISARKKWPLPGESVIGEHAREYVTKPRKCPAESRERPRSLSRPLVNWTRLLGNSQRYLPTMSPFGHTSRHLAALS